MRSRSNSQTNSSSSNSSPLSKNNRCRTARISQRLAEQNEFSRPEPRGSLPEKQRQQRKSPPEKQQESACWPVRTSKTKARTPPPNSRQIPEAPRKPSGARPATDYCRHY